MVKAEPSAVCSNSCLAFRTWKRDFAESSTEVYVFPFPLHVCVLIMDIVRAIGAM